MKKIAGLIIALGFSCSIFAEGESTQEQLNSMGSISSGLRVGIVKSSYKIEINASNADIDQKFGVTVGYAQVEDAALGFMAQGLYSVLEDDATLTRIEASATYGFGERFYGIGGANMQMIDTDGADIGTGVGFQIGVGAQVHKMVGITLSYVSTNHPGDDEATVRGFDMALNATF